MKSKESRNLKKFPKLLENKTLYQIITEIYLKNQIRRQKMKNLKTPKINFTIALLFSSIALLSGCSDMVNSPTPGSSENINIGISMKADNAGLNHLDQIVIDDAKALIKEVEFETEGTGEDKEIEVGPFVIHFIIDGSIRTLASSTIPQGNFTKIKFQIHKPEDNEIPPDPEFMEGTSGNLRYSFIIKGKINSVPFVFKSRKSANIVINLDNAIGIQSGSKNVTILFSNAMWFLSNGITIDPRDPNNENEIDDNLKGSFRRAFEDNDKNGEPDGH